MKIPMGNISLEMARQLLRAKTADGTPADCPCCLQRVQIQPRSIYRGMAKDLITVYRKAGLGWFHRPSLLKTAGGDFSKLRFWDLIEEETSVRREDGGRAGYYRVRPEGQLFVRGIRTVPKYARIFDNKLVGELYGPQVSIVDCLGDQFDYDELMGRRFPPLDDV